MEPVADTAGRNSVFAVRLDVFQGPLDLLLTLIERRELDISTVSLMAVTSQFLRVLESQQDTGLDIIAGYLVVAAKLLYIKSAHLLPPTATIAEDGEEIPNPMDSAEALARQLREYRRYKLAAAWLAEREAAGLRSWPRRVPPGELRQANRPKLQIPLDLFPALVLQAYSRGGRADVPGETVLRTTVAQRLEDIRALLARTPALSFRELVAPDSPLEFIVATFLAVLELVRRREADVAQHGNFGEITVRHLAKRPAAPS